MGAGAAKQKYDAGEPKNDVSDAGATKKPQPRVIKPKATTAKAYNDNFVVVDNNAWRAPREKGAPSNTTHRPPPPKVRKPPGVGEAKAVVDEASTWSPRQGGLSKREREALEAFKEKQKEVKKQLALEPGRQSVGSVGSAEASSSPKQANRPQVFHALPYVPLPNVVPEESSEHAAPESHGRNKAQKFHALPPPTEEPADFAELADGADKVWKELLHKLTNSKDGIEDLFLFDELKAAVEAAEKKIDGARRKAATAKSVVEDRKKELDEICSRAEGGHRHRATCTHHWKRSDLALRLGFGLCEVLAVHHRHGEARVEIRMVNTGAFASPSLQDLLPLTLPQETSVKKKMQEIEEATREQENMDREVMQVQKELRSEHQRLTAKLDNAMQKHDLITSAPSGPVDNVDYTPPQGVASMDLAWTKAGKAATPGPMPNYPNMNDLFSAAQDLLRTPTPFKPPTPQDGGLAGPSFGNTPTTQGTEPSAAPGGITRDMLPTPIRFQINEDVEDDEDDIAFEDGQPFKAQTSAEAQRSQENQTQPVPTLNIPQTNQEADGGDWVAYQDEDGDTYYHNEKTGETEWTLPPGARVAGAAGANATQAASSSTAPGIGAAAAKISSNATFSGASTTTGSKFTPSPGPQPAPQDQRPHPTNEWIVYYTDEGAPYYYNKLTSETSWELPPGVVPCSADQEQWSQYAGAASSQQQWTQQAQGQQTQQQEQWSQYYSQYWSWYQQEQDSRQQQGANDEPSQPSLGLSPPSPDATVEEQLAYAMKVCVLKEMETMVAQGAPLPDRKKALKNLQIKWHPDKNPEQITVAKGVFQLLGDKKDWFLQEHDPADDLELEVDAVD